MLSQTAHKQIHAQVEQNLFTVGAIANPTVAGIRSVNAMSSQSSQRQHGMVANMQPKHSTGNGVTLSNRYATQ